MKKEEIILLYIGDLKNIVPQSEARDNRIKQLETELQNTPSNNDYAKLPTIEECYQAIPFPSNERDCAMFVAGIAECHKFVSRHFA